MWLELHLWHLPQVWLKLHLWNILDYFLVRWSSGHLPLKKSSYWYNSQAVGSSTRKSSQQGIKSNPGLFTEAEAGNTCSEAVPTFPQFHSLTHFTHFVENSKEKKNESFTRFSQSTMQTVEAICVLREIMAPRTQVSWHLLTWQSLWIVTL